MEHIIEQGWVDSCKNLQRKGQCLHFTMRSYRRERNFFYVKDSVFCYKTKELLTVKKIQTISSVDFWDLRVVRYGRIKIKRPLAWGVTK